MFIILLLVLVGTYNRFVMIRTFFDFILFLRYISIRAILTRNFQQVRQLVPGNCLKKFACNKWAQ